MSLSLDFIGKESVFMRQAKIQTNEKVVCGERQNLSSRSKRRHVERIFIFDSMLCRRQRSDFDYWVLKKSASLSFFWFWVFVKETKGRVFEDDSTVGCNCSSASGAVSELRRSHDVWALHIQLSRRRRSHADVERVNLQVQNHRRSQTKYNSSQ